MIQCLLSLVLCVSPLFASAIQQIDEEILHRVSISPTEITQIQKLESYTNHNYLVTTNKKKVVVRIPGDISHLYIDRQIEHDNYLIAKEYGFDPLNVLFFDPSDGLQVTDYLEEGKFIHHEKLTDSLLIDVAKLLQHLHGQSFKFSNSFNPFIRLKAILENLQKDAVLPLHFVTAQKTIRKMEKQYKKKLFISHPCHNDPVPSNFVRFDQKMGLIDWEYAGNNDPGWDLSNFVLLSGLNEEQTETFIHAYSSKDYEEFGAKVIFFKPLIHLTISAWAALKAKNCAEDLVSSFQQLSNSQFEKYRIEVSSKKFKAILKKYESMN